MGTYDKDKNDRTRVKKRSRTLVSKANELAKVPGVNIYLLITYPRANIVYKSLNEASWPPSDRNLVRVHKPSHTGGPGLIGL